MKTAIIVPCYNEASRLIIDDFLNFAKANADITLYFYNDGSTDETLSVIKSLSGQLPNLKYIDGKINRGKGASVRNGMLHVINNEAAYDLLGFIDADLAAPLCEINNLISSSTVENEVISGARVKMMGKDIQRSMLRHYFSRVFATYYSVMLSLVNYDTQCGLKIFRRNVVEDLFGAPFKTKWLFDLELYLRAKKLYGELYKIRVVEIPLNTWIEKGGSKIKPVHFLKAPLEVLKIYLKYK